jgi:hypothetical protein
MSSMSPACVALMSCRTAVYAAAALFARKPPIRHVCWE